MKAAHKDTVVSRRDSATAILRKLGIAKADYNKFIGEVEGKFVVEVTAAVRSLQPVKKVVKASEGKVTLSATIRSMVVQGMTNEEIRDSLKLPQNKRHYPAWYRAEMNRKAAH